MKYSDILWLAVFSIIFIACEEEKPIENEQEQTTVDVNEVEQVANANQAFGLDVFQEEVNQSASDENVLISPLSIHTALNMAVNGAAGTSKNQMLDVLHSSDWAIDQLNEEQQQWRMLLKEQSGHPVLTEANAFFKDPNRINARESFEQALAKYYKSDIRSLDFTSPNAKDEINQWVQDNTQGKIEEIVEEIKSRDIAFLINAIHFKSDWARGFEDDLTYQDEFKIPDNSTVQVQYINGDDQFNIYESESYWGVDLPFKDSTYSLTMLKPKEGVTFKQYWINGLTVDFIDDMYEQMDRQRAHIHFPKMELAYKNEMSTSLKDLGMTEAFSPLRANFSQLGNSPLGGNIYLTRVQHKSVLEIDEQGAEGAATTSVGVGVISIPEQIKFDEEFMVILRHVETNTPVFMGRISNPSDKSY